MSPVEAVARGLFEENKRRHLSPTPVTFNALHPDTRAKWDALSRAAIESLAANVTDEMVSVFNEIESRDMSGRYVHNAIAAALRAALSEQKEPTK